MFRAKFEEKIKLLGYNIKWNLGREKKNQCTQSFFLVLHC